MHMFEKPHKTFMEILKVNNKEVSFANLLAFFFRPNEKHNLKNLFIETLLNTICSELKPNISNSKNNILAQNGFELENIEDCIGENVKVITEQKTSSKQNLLNSELNNKRIDILIVAKSFVICIEFKINHELNNPLEEYKKFIAENYPFKRKYYVVLTTNRKEIKDSAKNNTEFKQIILSQFVANIKQNLPLNFKTNLTANKYYDYFIDFIQTIENRKIKFERYNFFKNIEVILKRDNKIIVKIHNQNEGFLKIQKNNTILKLRFYENNQVIVQENIGWSLENWSDNKNNLIELFEKNINSKEIIEKINISLNK